MPWVLHSKGTVLAAVCYEFSFELSTYYQCFTSMLRFGFQLHAPAFRIPKLDGAMAKSPIFSAGPSLRQVLNDPQHVILPSPGIEDCVCVAWNNRHRIERAIVSV